MPSIVSLLLTYRYYIIFPLSIPEGPILTIICGFFVSLGLLNAFAVYALVLLGDIVGDSIMYAIGRWGGARFVGRYGRYLGIDDAKLQKAKEYFRDHEKKALVFSKLIHGIGVAGIFSAGSLHVPYKQFVKICGITSAVQSVILLVVGILFGHAFEKLNGYLNLYASATIIGALLIGAFFVIKKLWFSKEA